MAVKTYRSILSLLLLSAYALLLLHDFIPHTHHNHQGDVSVASAVHHSHDDHHHSHEHHEEEEKNDRSPESSDHNLFGDLIQPHSHSGCDGHQHELVYRASAPDKLIPQVETAPCLGENLWKIPDRFDYDISWQWVSLPPPSDPHLYSGHGLRAPPALG